MKQTLAAEAHILDRIMYLLEEKSVDSVVQADTNFGSFVDKLYQTVQQQSQRLRHTAPEA